MITTDGHGNTTITGDSITLYRHMAIASALGLEVNTGMKMSHGRSTMQVAAGVCGSTKRTKKGVLADYVAWMKTTYPAYTPAPSIVRALAK
jgi:hypothetical protein